MFSIISMIAYSYSYYISVFNFHYFISLTYQTYKRFDFIYYLLKMEKYQGFDKDFYDYLFDKIVTDGGLRLQIIAADLVNQLQKNYDPKHNLNLFRKQYGNIYEALKAMKNKPFFDLDNSVIRMKNPQIVRTLGIKKELMQKYQQKLKSNHLEQIKIMKINNENKCKNCDKVYNVNVNKQGSCNKNSTHSPLY